MEDSVLGAFYFLTYLSSFHQVGVLHLLHINNLGKGILFMFTPLGSEETRFEFISGSKISPSFTDSLGRPEENKL